MPSDKLASRVLPFASLLETSEAALQRKHDALVATMGPEAAQVMLCVHPELLTAAEDRAALNIASLRQLFGISRGSAAGILSARPKLVQLDMQSEAAAARLGSRVSFWQQAYQLPTAGRRVRKACMLTAWQVWLASYIWF